MKIKSKIKDYYDYVQHIYGGGDEKVIYNRMPLVPLNEYGHRYNIEINCDVPRSVYQKSFRSGWMPSSENNVAWLIVCGKIYIVIRYGYFGQYKIINQVDLDLIIKSYSTYYRYNNKSKLVLEDFLGIEVPEKFYKAIGHPVAIFNVTNSGINLNPIIPNLGDCGFAKYMDPELLYQEISYFITNKLSANPDTVVPVQIEDKYKITQAGFDLKQSFRHRK